MLKPGGVLRIATPDLDWLGASVSAGIITCDLVNSTFYEHGHRYIYSRAEMLAALVAAGFTEARHSTYKDPASELGFLDSHADSLEVNIEQLLFFFQLVVFALAAPQDHADDLRLVAFALGFGNYGGDIVAESGAIIFDALDALNYR